MEDLYTAEQETLALVGRARAQELGESRGKAAKRDALQPRGSRQMWVDKYRPKRFADLLGEDVRVIRPPR